MNMRFGKAVAVVLLGLGCAVAAQAQAGVYFGYTATRLSGITCFAVSPVTCSNGVAGETVSPTTGLLVPTATGTVNPAGVGGGVYYDFKTFGPVRLGLDLRAGDFHSNKSTTSAAGGDNATGFTNVLLGVRGSFHTRYSWLSPYVQASAGYARSNATLPFGAATVSSTGVYSARTEDNFLQYEGFAGIDIHVFPVIDLRPVELGIGNMNRVGSSAATDGPGSIGVKSIGAAIVFHLPSSQ
jgi:hypothetical protein